MGQSVSSLLASFTFGIPITLPVGSSQLPLRFLSLPLYLQKASSRQKVPLLVISAGHLPAPCTAGHLAAPAHWYTALFHTDGSAPLRRSPLHLVPGLHIFLLLTCLSGWVSGIFCNPSQWDCRTSLDLWGVGDKRRTEKMSLWTPSYDSALRFITCNFLGKILLQARSP